MEMDLIKKLIVPTVVDEYGKNKDWIYLPSCEELRGKYGLDATDLVFSTDGDYCHDYWLRKTNSHNNNQIDSFHIRNGCVVFQTDVPQNYQADYGVRPCMRFSVEEYLKFIQSLNHDEKRGYLPYYVTENERGYMCINFGQAPCRDLAVNKKNPVGARLEKEYVKKQYYLDKNYLIHAVDLQKLSRLALKIFDKGLRNFNMYKFYPEEELRRMPNTYYHKSYHFNKEEFTQRKQHLLYNQEYSINGVKFVRDGYRQWAPVRDLRWRILNWDNLPKSINPLGNETDDTIDLYCCQTVNQMPYYLDRTQDLAAKRNLWQDSTIRGYLNGYDFLLNKDYSCAGYSPAYSEVFLYHNFMTECFNKEMEMLKAKESFVEAKKQTDMTRS